MSQYPPPPTNYDDQPGQPQKPKKGWFGRNWWWFIPLIVIAPFVCCCGSCGGLAYFGMKQFENMPPYKDTVALVETDAEVQAELGAPVKVAGLLQMAQSGGSVNGQQSGTSSMFNAEIPVSGSKASGWLFIEADIDVSGNWVYTRREIVVDGSGKTIDLMPADGNAEQPDADGRVLEIPDQD